MTWFAVPNDVAGGWAVANRQAPTSQLHCECGHHGDEHWTSANGRGRGGCYPCDCSQFEPDGVIADGVKSEADARRIAAGLNFAENGWRGTDLRAHLVERYSEPWPGAEVER